MAGAGALVGRDGELEAIRRLTADTQVGGGSGLVILGAPGLGKSALLEAAGDEYPGDPLPTGIGTRVSHTTPA